jgi:AsmA protein
MDDEQPLEAPSELWQAGAPLPKRRARKGSAKGVALAGYLALGLACAGLAVLTFLVIAAPAELVRDELVEQVRSRTGRELKIAGPTSLTFFPGFGVRVQDLALAAPDGMEGAPMLAVESLEALLEPLSLLTRRVVVKRLVLRRPVLELRIDAQGRRSWEFAAAPIRLAQLAPTGAASDLGQNVAGSGREDAGALRLERALDALASAGLTVIDGTLRYSDAQSGTRQELSAINLEFAKDPVLGAAGSFAWHGSELGFEAASPLRAAAGEAGQRRLELKVHGAPFEAAFAGLATHRDAGFTGSLSLNARSARAFWRWVGGEPFSSEEGPELGLEGQIELDADRVALGAFNGTLGADAVSGGLELQFRPGPPRMTGQIKLSELNVGGLVHARSGAPTAEPAAAAVAGSPEPARLATGGTGTPARSWSEEPIDLSLLAHLDADLSLSVDRLVYERLRTEQGRLHVAVHDRVAKVTLEDVQLYEGRVHGVLTFDGSGPIPVTATTATLEGVSVLPLLKDALGIGWLEGRSTIAVALAGQGASERQIVESLNGKVELATANGAIVGWNVGKLLRALEQARLPVSDKVAAERTPFSECAATFIIAHGVAENQDLRVVNPAVSVTGSGTVHLAKRELDYTLRAKVTANPSHEGAVVNLAGLELPVRLHGPWDAPAVDPVLKGVVKDQDKAAAVIKQIGKNLQSPEVQDAVRGLIGGDGTVRVKPRELLDKLLKHE